MSGFNWGALLNTAEENFHIKVIFAASLLLAVSYLAYLLYYGFFMCPTRHIPGPFFTRFTYGPYYLLLFRGKGCMETLSLHQKYGTLPPKSQALVCHTALTTGPVVRLAPDIVDVQSVDAAQHAWAGIHPHLPWDKDPDFCRMVRAGQRSDNVLSTQKAKDAMRVRRLVGTPFAKKFLLDQEEIFKRCTKKMMRVLEEASERDGTVDVMNHFMKYSFDLLSCTPPFGRDVDGSGVCVWGVF